VFRCFLGSSFLRACGGGFGFVDLFNLSRSEGFVLFFLWLVFFWAGLVFRVVRLGGCFLVAFFLCFVLVLGWWGGFFFFLLGWYGWFSCLCGFWGVVFFFFFVLGVCV